MTSPSHVHSDANSDCDCSMLFEQFHPVRNAMNFSVLPVLALCVRANVENYSGGNINVHTIETPKYGSYNICYPILFADGVRWLLKVPANGTREKFGPADARALRSEALTMHMLTRETEMPIPRVFALSESCDNALNCPFILMQFVEGKPLSDVWFDEVSPKELVQQRREYVLRQLAAAMFQLRKFAFNKAGALIFSRDNPTELIGIGPMRLPDWLTVLDNKDTADGDDNMAYFALGCFSTPKEYFSAVLDIWDERKYAIVHSPRALHRMLLDWIPEPADGRKPFVLAHPDYDLQNIIVAEDGTLCGLIDWDGVAAVPQSVGCERYPQWLTQDWDEAYEEQEQEQEQKIEVEEDVPWQDSPATRRQYRRVYAQAMRELRAWDDPNGDGALDVTRNSLVCHNLRDAAMDPLDESFMTAFDGMDRLIREMDPGACEEDGLPAYDLLSVVIAHEDGLLTEAHRKVLKMGFEALLEAD